VSYGARRLIAGFTLIGAIVLLYFELVAYRSSDSWFWVLLGGFAIVLAIIELLAPRPPS
jgi:hypothetical protein